MKKKFPIRIVVESEEPLTDNEERIIIARIDDLSREKGVRFKHIDIVITQLKAVSVVGKQMVPFSKWVRL